MFGWQNVFFVLTLPFTDGFSKSSGKPFGVNLSLTVRPENRDKFIALIKNDQQQSLSNEPGILQFTLGEDTETPNKFYLHEQYKTEDDFKAHTETTWFNDMVTFSESNPWDEGGEPVINFFSGEHSPERVETREAFCLNVDLFVKDDRREAFLPVIQNNKKGSDNDEPLCLQYTYGESNDTPNTFHFHEEYLGKEGFDAHTVAPHFVAWETFAGTDPFTKPPVVSFYKTF
eukprot:CAMPEP_0194421086 /NCGR_PEP_ID=MMETSP0176-20130528/20340_1 /TAXON_ID=216777 /ORGANISM="Proboscia alata, Strain PI-D3" /LENGTH=229 /DNA_ID=CAMNT_0039229027 /DNA_START=18 /DNA_END=707 /DNA_ORIENTATION=-